MRLFVCVLALTALLSGQPLPVSTPEKEGMSTERLKRMHLRLQDMAEHGQRAGFITLLVRNGRIVDWTPIGYRDISKKLPMEKDTICRIYSMTKVVTTVAAMMLVEEGRLSLSDPVSKHIPELKGMRVLAGGTAAAPQFSDPVRPMTVKHLMTHSSGLIYGWGSDTASDIYRKANYFRAGSLKEFAANVAKLPLAFQPGEKYEYGIGIDVLGYVVESVSGMPFDAFVQQRILTPLKMNDTYWRVPEEKLSRVAKIYTMKEGKLTENPSQENRSGPVVPYGGMGLYSTIADYARFGQMLLNGGALDGQRLLSRKTVELMTGNHLSTLKVPSIDANGAYGFGLGGSVRLDVAKGGIPGTVGQFGWDGAASTYFRMDPKERLVTLLFQQYMPFDQPTLELFSTLAYQAIVD